MINRDRISQEFARQCAIASPSFKEAEISAYLKQRFAAYGAHLTEDKTAEQIGSQSNNLIFSIPGEKAGEPFLLSGHMDTVGPTEGVEPILEDGVFRSAGNTILGADDKSGLAEIIEALEVLREQQIVHVPLEIVITVCEEVGLLGAKHLDFSLIRSRRGIALDTTGMGYVVNKAPAANRYHIEITGQAAHAGVIPENGISAIAIAARAISRIPQGRIDAQTTANIGLINGGQAINIVPRQVCLDGEIRSHDSKKLQQLTEQIIAIFKEEVEAAQITVDGQAVKAQMTLELEHDFPAMKVEPESDILRLIAEAAQAIDFPLQVKEAGGGSDANVLNANGIETVILATGMHQVHSVDEEVRVDDMVQVARLLVETIARA